MKDFFSEVRENHKEALRLFTNYLNWIVKNKWELDNKKNYGTPYFYDEGIPEMNLRMDL